MEKYFGCSYKENVTKKIVVKLKGERNEEFTITFEHSDFEKVSSFSFDNFIKYVKANTRNYSIETFRLESVLNMTCKKSEYNEIKKFAKLHRLI